MIYDAIHPVQLLRIVYDRGDWHRETGKWPSKKEEERMLDGVTTYCVAKWPDQSELFKFIVDVAKLRADGGMQEIIETVARLA